MRPVGFLAVSIAYAAVATFVWMQILLKCGLGPDSPAVCNQRADEQAFWFSVGAVALYVVFSIYIWRRKRAKG